MAGTERRVLGSILNRIDILDLELIESQYAVGSSGAVDPSLWFLNENRRISRLSPEGLVEVYGDLE